MLLKTHKIKKPGNKVKKKTTDPPEQLNILGLSSLLTTFSLGTKKS